ncbi:MAG: hypothetical protein ACI4UA_07195 [Bacteroidaceae bacterium]
MRQNYQKPNCTIVGTTTNAFASGSIQMNDGRVNGKDALSKKDEDWDDMWE